MRIVQMLSSLLLLFTWGLLDIAGAQPGDTLTTHNSAGLRIGSSPDSAMVYVNGRLAGKTPLRVDSLEPGLYRLCILHPDTRNWLTPTVTDSVHLNPGEQKILRFSLSGGIMIQSLPEGAWVVVRDSLIGLTPLVLLPGRWSPFAPLEIRKEGYDTVSIDPNMAVRGIISVPLKKVWKATSAEESPLQTGGEDSGRALRLYISGGIGVLGGIASAYFKISADGRQEDYLLTGNPVILSERKKLDTAAGISLAITQASLALFSYFLLEE